MVRRLIFVAAALSACGPPPPPPPPATIHTTYRALTGLSMGAIGTAAIGFRHPERFDAFAALGGPLDAQLLLRMIDRFHLGGFCPRAQLEQNLATINDPRTAGCVTHPSPIKYEHVQDYNHWVYTTNAPFDRAGYIGLFVDLTLAFGNLLTENPLSTFAPPGVTDDRARRPPADFCTNPVHIKGIRNLEYNADGKYDAITFCDGEPVLYYCSVGDEVVDFCSDPANVTAPLPHAMEAAFAAAYCAGKGGVKIATNETKPALMLANGGRVDPCREQSVPVPVALAFDFNGNGRRDYGEPVVDNGEERYQDVGADGCDDAHEDGKGGCKTAADPAAVDPNHDDYDADTNPHGTENDWKHDDGEPFSDDGLDGVPGTQDTGEGNHAFDMTSGRQRLYAHDARANLAKLMPEQIARLRLLLDGGIRDLFNFGLTSHQVYGAWKALRPDDTKSYRDWTQIPGMSDSQSLSYHPWGGPWRRAPQNIEVLFGTENPTLDDRIIGDGDHVGTNGQAVNRISTLFAWAGAQWPALPRPSTPLGMGATYDERVHSYDWFDSHALGAKRGYGIFLPPGYDLAENAQVRYPVLYLLHGYTGDQTQVLRSVFLADTFMKDTDVKLRPMIIVCPSGACCFVNHMTGARDCRELDDSGAPFGPPWERECVGGSFFVSHVGASKYEESFLELMDAIDAKYRTLPAADVTER